MFQRKYVQQRKHIEMDTLYVLLISLVEFIYTGFSPHEQPPSLERISQWVNLKETNDTK